MEGKGLAAKIGTAIPYVDFKALTEARDVDEK
jgi:hypothetical protein